MTSRPTLPSTPRTGRSRSSAPTATRSKTDPPDTSWTPGSRRSTRAPTRYSSRRSLWEFSVKPSRPTRDRAWGTGSLFCRGGGAAKEAVPIPSRRFAAVAVLLVLIVSSSVGYFLLQGSPSDCSPLGGKAMLRSRLTPQKTGGAVTTYTLPSPDRFPNGVAVAADGSVWFGEQGVPGLGHLYSNGTLVEYALPNGKSSVPAEIAFANSTRGYYVDVGGAGQAGGLYQFDPQKFAPVRVGANMTLYAPNSLALGTGGVWVSQHEAASLVFYDLATKAWTTYPTSTVNYVDTTLPYFVRVNGSKVWFNEHYADRIALIDFATQSLTEYSIQSRRPASVGQITNSLTFALGRDGAWFAEYTGNTIGFVDASFKPALSLSLAGSNHLRLATGGKTDVTLTLADATGARLTLQAADSENLTSIPRLLRVTPAPANLTLSKSPQPLPLTIQVDSNTIPGEYTLLLTVSDGQVYRSVYIKVQVVP